MTNEKKNIRDACISIEQLRKIHRPIGSWLHLNHYVGTSTFI